MSREDWPDVRAHIVSEFAGEQPGNELEQTLIDLYATNPSAVLNAVPSIAQSLAAGKINSGWAVLRTAAAKKAVEPQGTTIGRAKLIRNADQWLKTAGLMYDRWSEVEDELFGDRGRLRTIANDKLKDRYQAAWNEVRPQGETTETDELERAQAWKEARAKIVADPAPTNPEEALARLRTLATRKGARAWANPSLATPTPPQSTSSPSTKP
jgi:hypothetical protein